MRKVIIRPAAAGDIEAITRIYADAVLHGTASFEIEPPDETEMLRRQTALLKNGYPYFAAEIGSVVAGYAYAGSYRSRPAYKWSVEDSVYVAPNMHRKGIGGLLLRALVAASTQRGYRQMIAVIGDSAQIGSIALHDRAGFGHIGTLRSVGFKHGKWLDTVLMQRGLGPGDTTAPSKPSP
jgi:phosphinothricin acetyltransferase